YVMPGGPGGKSLAALDKMTGKTLWQGGSDPAGYSSPVSATMHGIHQILFFTGKRLVSVDPHNGKEFWSFPWDTNYDCNIATPIVIKNYVFISSGYGKGCAMLVVDKDKDGTLAVNWVYKNNRMRNHFSTSVRDKEEIYGFNEDVLTCMDLRTGKV